MPTTPSIDIAKRISAHLSISERQVANTLQLLASDCTIPFISRYRKEATGGLDEVQVEHIQRLNQEILDLEKRRTAILEAIEEQGKLSAELRSRISSAQTMSELEDLYLPYKKKKNTKAEIARQLGLEPLAKMIMSQNVSNLDTAAARFVKGEVTDEDDAISRAADIITEWVSEDVRTRNKIRASFRRTAQLTSKVVKGKEEEAAKYRDYFDFHEPLSRCSSHRLLAVRRGESEGMLKVSIASDDDRCIQDIEPLFVRGANECSSIVRGCVKDAYRKYARPAIETEFAAQSKQKADEEAIGVFAQNLRQLLLASPLGEKNVLALDPGFRTGCKLVCLSSDGQLKAHDVIYPHPPAADVMAAKKKLLDHISRYSASAIAIGDGTASRETESFALQTLREAKLDAKVEVYVVSESGASIYSASQIARDEFPDQDVTVRGAVSIGRRLQDPLAELVKIDPKSIGVGQYQHDVDQRALRESLDRVVESAVNHVGVNLNTASVRLLTYVSGLGPQLAQNIVDYRSSNGAFTSRQELLSVPRLGKKAYEQCAGFLRIRGAANPLDNTAVHPESYSIVKRMASSLGVSVDELIRDGESRRKLNLSDFVSGSVGLPTLTDIMRELEKPGLDVRQKLTPFAFDPSVTDIQSLRIGMILPGIVTNITKFGAFVKIGIHDEALLHISQIANRRIADPSEVLSIGQRLQVKVVEIDEKRNRVGVSLKDVQQ